MNFYTKYDIYSQLLYVLVPHLVSSLTISLFDLSLN
jgi:hypothetical protein